MKDPDILKLQAQSQLEDKKLEQDKQLKIMQMQIDEKKAAADSQAEIARLQAQAQVDTNQAEQDARLEQFKAQITQEFDKWKATLDSETKITVAQIQAKAQLQNTALAGGLDPTVAELASNGPTISDLMGTVISQLQATLGGVMESHNALSQRVQELSGISTKPKIITLDNGRTATVQVANGS